MTWHLALQVVYAGCILLDDFYHLTVGKVMSCNARVRFQKHLCPQ